MGFLKDYLLYLNHNPEGYWFKRKLYGWGWVPARWQGWATLFIFIALIVANFVRVEAHHGSVPSMLVHAVPETVILVIILIAVCFITGEPPKWSWGLPKTDDVNDTHA